MNHEFFDSDIVDVSEYFLDRVEFGIKDNVEAIVLTREDVIVLAKHFNIIKD